MARPARWISGAACLLALLAAGSLLDVVHRPPPPPRLNTEDGAPVILAGCVVEPAVLAANREQFVLELEPGARIRVNLYLREGEEGPALRYGQRVEIDAKVRSPHNFENPGAFDYVHYLARQDVFWTASARAGAKVRAMPGECGNRFMRAIFAIRMTALDRIETLYRGDSYDTGMMQAILIGESSKLEKVWTEQFRSTGTFHAIVISGSHVAVLAAFLLFLLRICFVPRGIAMLLTVLAAWLYAFVTGWQAPVIRSAAGMALFAFGGLFFRERRILNLLAAVAILFLVFDPEQMFDPSFQLSFLAVALIAVFSIPLIEATCGPLVKGLSGLEDRGRDLHLPPRAAQFRIEMRLLAETVHLRLRLPAKASAMLISITARIAFYLYELILTSAVIQIGLALPMAIYFHRVSFSGLSANAMVLPLFELIVPVGFIAIFTGWHFVAAVGGWLLTASRLAVEWHAGMEPNWRIPTPPLWLSIAFCAALIIAAIRFRSKWTRTVAAISVAIFLGILIWHPFAPKIERGVLEMTAIDVGQGDSVLVAFPDGKLLLMDGGGIPTFGKRAKTKIDIGEDVVSPYLWTRSIRRIDVVALSHAHDDHIGGLPAILDNFDVGELWTGATPESPSWDALYAKAVAHHLKIRAMHTGAQFAYGGAKVQVLAPSLDYVPSITPKNNDSLVLRLVYGRNSFLMTGDMEKQIESELLAGNLVQHADVLKVGHHGSRTSSLPEFLDAVHPAFAVISDGFENSYGHPAKQTLEHLSERRILTLRTDTNGLISIRSNGRFLQR
ncbi:MAG: ComEC/Rec2 family competence protein [Acidobacteriota bacterium]|nr:ComEC/Rec2 family competence protein [Acidobacteriota bacterium]